MAEHPNIEKIRRGFDVIEKESMSEEDMAFVDDLFDDDIVWTMRGSSQIAGVKRGKQEVFAALAQVDEESNNTFTREIKQILADDEHGVCLMRIRAARGENRQEWDEVAVFTFSPEGRIKEFWGITEDLEMVDAFWAS
jgi:ketosteroid isomerase-like protein